MSCDFCEGKRIPPIRFGSSGIHTMRRNLAFLFGNMGYIPVFMEEHEPDDYIQLEKNEDGYFLTFQNSSGEYAKGFAEIKYCPLCGKKLEEEKR